MGDDIFDRPGKIEFDGRTSAQVAIDAEIAAALLGETVDQGEPQASAFSDRLRTRKETIALTAADSLRRRAALAARPDSIVT